MKGRVYVTKPWPPCRNGLLNRYSNATTKRSEHHKPDTGPSHPMVHHIFLFPAFARTYSPQNLVVELRQRSQVLSTVVAAAGTRFTHKFPVKGLLWGGLVA